MTATYIYAVTAGSSAGELKGAMGIGQGELRFLDADGMSCLVSTVDLSEFGEEGLRKNLENMTWLERTARAHDDVVRAVATVTPTLPLRLATVCVDDESARRRVNDFGVAAREALARVAGHDELGVKLYAVARASAAAPVDTTAASGASFLRQRRQQLQEQGRSADRVLRLTEEIFGNLCGIATDARRHRPHDRRLTGDERPMVLNAAFLVERGEQDSFRSAVGVLADAASGVSAVVTGPWPPYSFVPETTS
jgi:hypothetical protein